MTSGRPKALFLLVLIMTAVLVLAGSLDNLQFQPGLPFPGGEGADVTAAPAEPGPQVAAQGSGWIFFQAALALTFTAGLVFLAVILIKGLDPKFFAYTVLGLIVVLGLLILIPRIDPGPPTIDAGGQALYTPAPDEVYETTPLGAPPPGLNWAVAAGLGLLAAVLVGWWVRTSAQRGAEADAVKREAEDALRALRSGEELSSVILRCYQQMSRALQEEQGIERKEAMTAREFEELLKARGVPAEPVHRLTGLFEAARYGRNRTPTCQDEQSAVDSLTAITRYTRERKARPAA